MDENEKMTAGETVEITPLVKATEFNNENNGETLNHRKSGAGLAIIPILSIIDALLGAAEGICLAMLFSFSRMYSAENVPGPDGDESWYMYDRFCVRFTNEVIWQRTVSQLAIAAVGIAVLFAVVLILMFVLSGRYRKNEDGSAHMYWFDRIWSEIVLVAGIVSGAVAILCGGETVYVFPCMNRFTMFFEPREVFNDSAVRGIGNEAYIALMALAMAGLIWITVICAVSLMKKLKNGQLIKHSFIGLIWRKIFVPAGRTVRTFWRTLLNSEKFETKYLLIAIAMVIMAMTVVGGIVDIILIIIIAPKLIQKYEAIHEGARAVSSGDLSAKIPVEKDEYGYKTDLDMLASEINDISTAIEKAVKSELKNQRLKTELISNVSHDLKTPLTSMVSYIDLLKKEGMDSENAPEYLEILDQKTQRLKKLTENLFEAAKASSGNIPVEINDINMEDLLTQALAEMEDRLAARDLKTIIRNDCTNPMVKADGQLLWRVIENMLSNVSKYALEGSRVYLNLSNVQPQFGKGERLLLEVKNVSQNQLNISADELMERFKRGDESRNTEGSGLGLAIAKDLTNLMGGDFSITVDGDLFKAQVALDCR